MLLYKGLFEGQQRDKRITEQLRKKTLMMLEPQHLRPQHLRLVLEFYLVRYKRPEIKQNVCSYLGL